MMIGGAVVNALAFTGSNYLLFSHLGKSGDAKAERKRHDKDMQQLEEAQAAWSKIKNRKVRFYK